MSLKTDQIQLKKELNKKHMLDKNTFLDFLRERQRERKHEIS